ncbi:MAG: hypothetical protein ACYTEL_20615, partial [Planctomycetota bacterium]
MFVRCLNGKSQIKDNEKFFTDILSVPVKKKQRFEIIEINCRGFYSKEQRILFKGAVMKKFTRRQVFATAGITAGTYVISHLLTKKSFASEKDDKKSDFPWTYAKLDADVTAERAYTIT